MTPLETRAASPPAYPGSGHEKLPASGQHYRMVALGTRRKSDVALAPCNPLTAKSVKPGRAPWVFRPRSSKEGPWPKAFDMSHKDRPDTNRLVEGGGTGLERAIQRFMQRAPEWAIRAHAGTDPVAACSRPAGLSSSAIDPYRTLPAA